MWSTFQKHGPQGELLRDKCGHKGRTIIHSVAYAVLGDSNKSSSLGTRQTNTQMLILPLTNCVNLSEAIYLLQTSDS